MAANDPRLLGLSALLQLEKEARHAPDLQRLYFQVVNGTHQLLRYHQAAIWRQSEGGSVRLEAVSGLALIERDAPYVRWLEELLRHYGTTPASPDPTPLRALHRNSIEARFRVGWEEWVPGHALLCPLASPKGVPLGGLWLTRDTPWEEQECALLQLLLDCYQHAWWALRPRHRTTLSSLAGRIRSGRGVTALLCLAVVAGFLPVRHSALAPAEVSPVAPLVVAAPIEGVIDTFFIEPNQSVLSGEPLFTLDDTVLRNRLEVSRKALAVAEAEYLKASRKAFQDSDTKGEVALLEAKREQHRAEVTYTAELLQRVRVSAPQPGVAIFNDTNDWIGRPVTVGEKVLTLADPHRTELEIQLPVADAINPEPGAEVLFFPDTDPTHPLSATLTRTAYEARPTPAGTLAFRLVARFDPGEPPPRLGLQGTAKIYGGSVPLLLHILRRPYAAARQWLGM